MSVYSRNKTLNSNAPIRVVAGTRYKGQNPGFEAVRDASTGLLIGWKKVAKGIPYVKV